MLEDFRTCNRAVFGDVADNDDRDAAFFGKLQQHGGTLADLADRTWRRLDIFRRDGLDRVDDDKVGRDIVDVFHYHLDHRFASHLHGRCVCLADAVGTQFQLARALLAAHIQNPQVWQAQHGLQNQRRFADARFSAKKCERTRHESATQHAVQFVVMQVDARFVVSLDLGHREKFTSLSNPSQGGTFARSRFCPQFYFLERVPLATSRTFPDPLRRVISATAANVCCLLLCHNGDPSPCPPQGEGVE